MSDTQSYIHAAHLCFSYEGRNGEPDSPALRDVSLDIARGEYVAILGHNGSGKSTFAKLLNLILEPTSGELTVGGTDLTNPDMTEEELMRHRRRVGMVFQNPDNQLVATLVEEDVAFGPENLGVPQPELRRRVDDALATVGMTAYARQEPHRLSGGQKQRVAIAGILAMMPECIVFDESTAMLDPAGRREVLDTIRTLNRERGMTVLNITHYMNEAAEADRVIVINDGGILMDGSPDEVFGRRDALRAVGLEVPQCTELIHRLRAAGAGLEGTGISTPAGCAALLGRALGLPGEQEPPAAASAAEEPPAGTAGDASCPAGTTDCADAAADAAGEDAAGAKLRLEHVGFVYGAGTPFAQTALEDVSLCIPAGCITGVIGHTGSGKSTMMQLLNGLAKPAGGKVYLDGNDINLTLREALESLRTQPQYASLSQRAAKKAIRAELVRRRRELCFRVGLVMQYPEYQLFEETVYQDIAFGPKNMGLSLEEIDARVRDAAAFAGVEEDWLQRSPFDLSGGQKRRVAIAGVIAMRPEVLVLDEPAAGLDPRGRTRIFERICAYQKQTGSAVVIVSHSMEDMAQYCDRVAVLSGAHLILRGSREEVFSHTGLLEQVGLDIPQVTHLVRLLRARGADLPANVYTVDRAAELLLPRLTGRAGQGGAGAHSNN